jgi:hypothetical protein
MGRGVLVGIFEGVALLEAMSETWMLLAHASAFNEGYCRSVNCLLFPLRGKDNGSKPVKG